LFLLKGWGILLKKAIAAWVCRVPYSSEFRHQGVVLKHRHEFASCVLYVVIVAPLSLASLGCGSQRWYALSRLAERYNNLFLRRRPLITELLCKASLRANAQTNNYQNRW
jgi:hypothetical protein